MDINMISGVSNMFIYTYNNKTYYFLGDVHGTRVGSCHELGYKCDAFNYNFTDTTDEHTNCTTIGALLHNWFIYNNKHNIKTDFYLEEFYTNDNERQNTSEFKIIVNNRPTKNVKQGVPFKDYSWMELLPNIMAPCFIRDKRNCPYYPNVHLHYIDIRINSINNKLVDTTPFSIDLIYDYVQDNQPTTIQEFMSLREDVIMYINFLIKNYKILIIALLSHNGYQTYLSEMSKINNKLSIYMDEHVNPLTTEYEGVVMFRAAKELYRLSKKDTVIYESLIKYLYQMVEKVLFNVLKYEKKIENQINTYNTMKKRNLLEKKGLRRSYNELLEIINGYDLYFIDMQSVLMDAYTLSRMFLQDSEEIIVYAGIDHIKVYTTFFNQISEPDLEIQSVKNKTCLINDNIPKYINARKYKS
jgi:hypothetical protein